MVKRNSVVVYLKAGLGEATIQKAVKDFLSFHCDRNAKRGKARPVDYSLSPQPVVLDASPVFLGSEKKEAYISTVNVRSTTQSINLERDIDIFFYGPRIDFLADDMKRICG